MSAAGHRASPRLVARSLGEPQTLLAARGDHRDAIDRHVRLLDRHLLGGKGRGEIGGLVSQHPDAAAVVLVLEAAGTTTDAIVDLVTYHVDIEAHWARFGEIKAVAEA